MPKLTLCADRFPAREHELLRAQPASNKAVAGHGDSDFLERITPEQFEVKRTPLRFCRDLLHQLLGTMNALAIDAGDDVVAADSRPR